MRAFFANKDMLAVLCRHLDLTMFARQRLMMVNTTFAGLWKTHRDWCVFAGELVEMVRMLNTIEPEGLRPQLQQYHSKRAPFPEYLLSGKYVTFFRPQEYASGYYPTCRPRFALLPRVELIISIRDPFTRQFITATQPMREMCAAHPNHVILARKTVVTLLHQLLGGEGDILHMVSLAMSADLFADKKVKRFTKTKLPFHTCDNGSNKTPKWKHLGVAQLSSLCESEGQHTRECVLLLNKQDPPQHSLFVHRALVARDFQWLRAYAHVAAKHLIETPYHSMSGETLLKVADALEWYHTGGGGGVGPAVTREVKLAQVVPRRKTVRKKSLS